ncbi:MAG TPA: hypothetical protein VII19_06335 [Acidimicrobiales bacterium]
MFPVVLDGQATNQHAPGTAGIDPVHLEGDQPGSFHPLEEALTDPDHHVGAVRRIVDWQHQGSSVRGDADVAMEPLFRTQRQEAVTLGRVQDL